MNHKSVIHRFKDELLVNPATVSYFKKALRRKQTMLLSEDSTPLKKDMKITFQPARRDTKVRNKDIINALSLKIFFCWHSKLSIKHHKWSFCSINSVIISPKCKFIRRVLSRKTLVPTRAT
jgi:hypothetical protein